MAGTTMRLFLYAFLQFALTAEVSASFELGASNTKTCSSTARRIIDAKVCQQYSVERDSQYVEEHAWWAPNGCYVNTAYDIVVFNKHSEGSPGLDKRPVCAASTEALMSGTDQFRLNAANTNICASATMPVLDAELCRQYATQISSPHVEESSSWAPRGCYFNAAYDTVVFNKDSVGSPNSDKIPVCVASAEMLTSELRRFQLGVANTNTCSSTGAIAAATEACKQYARQTASHYMEEDALWAPRGCYENLAYDTVVFNRNSVGSPSLDKRPVCVAIEEFELGMANTRACSSTTGSSANAEVCKRYARQVASRYLEEEAAWAPSGCYLNTAYNTVVFNRHSVGAPGLDKRPVCTTSAAVSAPGAAYPDSGTTSSAMESSTDRNVASAEARQSHTKQSASHHDFDALSASGTQFGRPVYNNGTLINRSTDWSGLHVRLLSATSAEVPSFHVDHFARDLANESQCSATSTSFSNPEVCKHYARQIDSQYVEEVIVGHFASTI